MQRRLRGLGTEQIRCVVEKLQGDVAMASSPATAEGSAEVALGSEEGARQVLDDVYTQYRFIRDKL